MKIAMITDLHFGARRGSPLILDSQMKFYHDQFIPYLIENNIKNVFILGDTMDNRNTIDIRILNAVIDLFKKFEDNGITIHILIGNHDIFYKTSIETNSIKFLEKFDNVKTFADKNKILSITSDNGTKRKILMVPWIVNEQEFVNDLVTNKDYEGIDICMGHFEIKGFGMYKGAVCQEGLNVNIFEMFKKVYSGHFHHRSFKKAGNTHIEYIGNPYHLTRNDIDDERGFTVLDLDDLSQVFIENTQSSKFISVTPQDIITDDMIANNFVDIKISIDSEYDAASEVATSNFIKRIESMKPIVSPIIKTEHVYDFKDEIENLNEQIKMMTIPQTLNEFIKQMELTKENKKLIKEMIDEYYEKCKAE